MTLGSVQSPPKRTRRKMLELLAGLAVAAGIAFLYHLWSKRRRVHTGELAEAFAEVSTEARSRVQNVVTLLRSEDYLGAVNELKAITEGGPLSTNQQAAISGVLGDIESMPAARASTNAEAILEIVYELQPKLAE
jgi:hypothetical protein